MAAAAGNSKGICARCASQSCDVLICLQAHLATASDDDTHSTIKVAPKERREKPSGTIKLKKPAPKIKLPGNWKEGSVVDGMCTSYRGVVMAVALG